MLSRSESVWNQPCPPLVLFVEISKRLPAEEEQSIIGSYSLPLETENGIGKENALLTVLEFQRHYLIDGWMISMRQN